MALIQGEIAIVSIKIPNRIFNCGLTSSGAAVTMLTPNIITGILNNITTILPITKFLSLSKFIELDIEDSAASIGDPIINVIRNNNILLK